MRETALNFVSAGECLACLSNSNFPELNSSAVNRSKSSDQFSAQHPSANKQQQMKIQKEILLRPLRTNVRAVPARNANLLPKTQRRSLIPAPSANSGPLLDRRADRELPKVESRFGWARTLPIFAVLTGAAVLGIFNYQKSSSSVVSSTLYALRISPKAREVLGDEIYFANQIPWISGSMDQLHGRIDISYWVKGTKAKGKMTFKSVRPDRLSYFHTEEWTLETEDGQLIQLLAPDEDPFRAV